MRWSSRPPPAIPTRRCGGRARAHGRWRWRSTVWATASATRWSPSCCTDWATACRATPRFVRAATCRSGRAVSVHRPARATRATATAADDFGGHQEEGAGRRVQERGPHLAPGEDAAAGTGPRFVIPATATTGGKAIPYGIYDLRNEGWVSVGIDHDTASFAVRSIQRWWQHMGRPA